MECFHRIPQLARPVLGLAPLAPAIPVDPAPEALTGSGKGDETGREDGDDGWMDGNGWTDREQMETNGDGQQQAARITLSPLETD